MCLVIREKSTMKYEKEIEAYKVFVEHSNGRLSGVYFNTSAAYCRNKWYAAIDDTPGFHAFLTVEAAAYWARQEGNTLYVPFIEALSQDCTHEPYYSVIKKVHLRGVVGFGHDNYGTPGINAVLAREMYITKEQL